MKKLIVSKFKDGTIVRPSATKPGFATIMVIETSARMSNGFLNNSKRVAFVRGKKEDLEALAVKEGDNLNTIFANKQYPLVKIIRQESTTPWFEGQQAKINPQTKVAILYNGAPVFMQDVVVADVEAHQDDLLPIQLTPVFTGVTGAEAGDLAAKTA